ncbi:MAG: hypothetical protein WBR18_13090 [Anaerolineales bacterium]
MGPFARLSTGITLVSFLLVSCSPNATNPTLSPTETQLTVAPTEIPATSVPEPTAAPSPDWRIVSDDRIGIRYAIPCFWDAQVPDPAQDPTGLGSYTVRNFSDEFVQSFGNKRGDLIWENGAVKIDVLIFERATWDVPIGSSLEDMAQRALGSDPDTGTIESMDPITANGQAGLLVAQKSMLSGDVGHVWLFNLSPELVLGISPVPAGAFDSPDIQGIVDSLALGPAAEVVVPTFTPAPPPEGVDGSCLTATS